MKKTLALMISLLMLLSCSVEVFAEYDTDTRLTTVFTPEFFTNSLNEEIAYIVNAVYSSEDENQREDFISYVKLSYVENSDTFVWYDNEDWLIELSAYFRNGNADPMGCADTLTLSYPVGDEYALIYNTMGVSASALLSCLEEAIDFVRFSEYIDQCYYNYLETGTQEYDPLAFDGYQIGIMFYNQYDINRVAIALIRD